MTIKTTLFAATAAAAVAFAGAASAATIVNGGSLAAEDNGIGNGFTDPTEGLSFTYTATEKLRVLNFVSISSVGFSGGADLALVDFGISGDAGVASGSYAAGDITLNGATAEANSSLGGFLLEAGESFTLFFDYGAGVDTTSHQYSFDTAAVPLPAGILLLGTALGGLGIARRRKAQKAA